MLDPKFNKFTNNTKQLEDLVNTIQEPDTVKRNMVYQALSYGLGLKLVAIGVSTLDIETKVLIKKLIDQLNEIVIIDRLSTESQVYNVIKYLTEKPQDKLKDLYDAHCLCGVSGMANLYTKDDIEYITKNISTYRQVAIDTYHVFDLALENVGN